MKTNQILLLFSVIVIFSVLFSSCKKKSEDDPVPATNTLYGTWNLAQETPENGIFQDITHLVFTSDSYIYFLFEDVFGTRDRNQFIYSVNNNVFIITYVSFKFTFKSDSLFLEFQQGGRAFETVKFKKGTAVDQSTWLKPVSLGTPLFQVSAPHPIEGITWTGSKLWAIDEPWSHALYEINPTNGAIVSTVPTGSGYGSIGYGNNKLIVGYVGNVFFHNPVTGAQESVLTFTDFSHIMSICSDNSFIFFSTTNASNNTVFVKSNFSGTFIVTYDMDRMDDMTYGNGFVWFLKGTRVVKFDPYEMEAVDNYQISNINFTPGNGAIGFINGALWVVDGTNNFYTLNIP